MLLGRLDHLAAQLLDPRSQIAVHLIDRLRAVENHSDVIEELGLRWLVSSEFVFGDLMERQVVDPRAEIHVIRIRLPDHLHAEQLFVESARPRKVGDAKRQMPKPSMQWSRHSGVAVFSFDARNRLYSREPPCQPSTGNRSLRQGQRVWYDGVPLARTKEMGLMNASIRVLTVTVILLSVPAISSAAGLEKEVKGKDGAMMVLIPEGPFPMGVPQGDRDGGRDEYPRHDVFMDTFYIDKFEVTNGWYLEFVKATGHRVPQNPKNPTRNLWQGDAITESLTDRPVINVDWADADAYCVWAGKRLPTEAEWEKAAKGTADRRFPWGNVEPTDKHLNFNQQWVGEKTLMPVGSYEAGKSPFGVYDMAGNVWEWVNDWYDTRYYEKSPVKNPKGPDMGTKKVIRGAGWQNETPTVRIFTRVESDPTIRNESTGFRCAADIPK
ncbi:MAG: hypothetical protein EWM72_01473 [Nitrospira sp.]|nr:MAG: hypothetical protein EWM72_01473 [Nitrospira sp.]